MRRNGVGFLMILSFYLSACAGASNLVASTPTGEPTLAPPQLIEVQGRNMSIQCAGSGSPVVILESGLGVYSGTWHQVFPEVANFTRVCLYDRPGLGSSEPAVTPRTSEQMVSELQELLMKAEIPAPYLLVGQSFGGLNIHLFASTYPEEVVGMVFVDAIHPDFDQRLEPLLSPEQVAQRREELELNQEGIKFEDILTSEEQVSAVGNMLEMPIIVIRHGLPFEGDANWPTENVEALWEELQNDLATLSSQGKVIVAENSHHRIQEDRHDVVIAAIREVFDQARR